MLSFFKALAEQGANAANSFAYLTKKAIETTVDLETAFDEQTLVQSDGSLVSLIKVGGQRSIIESDEFARRQDMIAQTLGSIMKESGHIIHFIPSNRVGRDVSLHLEKSVFSLQRQAASRLGLEDISFLIDAWKSTMEDYVNLDENYIVIWTKPQILSQNKIKKAIRKRNKKIFSLPTVSYDGQRSGSEIDGLATSHRQAVNSIVSGLDAIEISANCVSAHEAIAYLRGSIRRTDKNWKPLLPGDPLPIRLPRDEDLSELINEAKGKSIDIDRFKLFGDAVSYPSINCQLLNNYTIEDDRIVSGYGLPAILNTGHRLHCPILLTLPPASPSPMFNQLYRNLINVNASWRMVTAIAPKGLDSLSWRSTLSGLFHFSIMVGNKRMNNAVDRLKEYEESGGVIVGYQVLFDVWVDRESNRDQDVKRLSDAVFDIVSALHNWQSADGLPPTLGGIDRYWSASLPMASPSLGTTVAAAPLADVINTLPFTRPAQTWDIGTMPFRSPDGKLLPFELFSSKQAAWIEIGVAPQGSAKSVTMNTLNFAFILASKGKELPLISILDIGKSSKGLITLLKMALGPARAHEAVSFRMRQSDKYRTNPFDTPLGCRVPYVSMTGFLINFVTLLLTPLGQKSAQDGISGLVATVIDYAYSQYAGVGAKLYTRGELSYIDREIDELEDDSAIDFNVDSKTSWWEITDALFDAGKNKAASISHRMAMPVLSDLANIVQDEKIKSAYNIKVAGGSDEHICDYVSRVISNALTLYPSISGVTKFEIGSEVKIISLDLEEIAPRGPEGSPGERQASIAYMMGRQIVAGRFFQTIEDVDLCPDLYKDYHRKRIVALVSAPKRFLLDEYHRVSHSPGVATQIESDLETAARETRKRNLSIGLYSHMIDDFPETILNLATSIFILGFGSEAELKRIDERLGIGNAVKERIRSLRKPRRSGAEMVALMKTEDGSMSQKIVLSLPPEILWSLTTVNEDARLRDELYSHLSIKETLVRLSKRYPSGIKDVIDSIAMEKDFDDNDIEAKERLSDNIINDIIEKMINQPN